MSDIARPSLVVSPELAASVDAGQQKMLKVPPDADQKGSGDKAEFTWIEQLKVIDTLVFPDKRNADVLVFEVKFRVPDDSPYEMNAGSPWDLYLRYNMPAMAKGDENDGQFKMSNISLRLLRQLAIACGIELPKGEEVDMVDYYWHKQGDEAMLTGSTVYARLQEKAGKDSAGAPRKNQNALRFQNEEGVAGL